MLVADEDVPINELKCRSLQAMILSRRIVLAPPVVYSARLLMLLERAEPLSNVTGFQMFDESALRFIVWTAVAPKASEQSLKETAFAAVAVDARIQKLTFVYADKFNVEPKFLYA
jgi:hypothetical protein